MRGRLEPKDTVERFWGLKFIGFPNLSDETPKPRCCASVVTAATLGGSGIDGAERLDKQPAAQTSLKKFI